MIKIIKNRFSKRTETEQDSDSEQTQNNLRYYIRELLDILLSSYYTPYLKWYEIVIIVIVGILSGIGVGIMIYSLIKYPQTIVIVFQNGSIVRIPVR